MLGLAERLLPHKVTQAFTGLYFKAQCLGRGMHSQESSSVCGGVRVHVLPALKDNYMYLVVDESTKEAVAVDPVDPAAMHAKAISEGVRLSTILTTHHHWDHAGGNQDLCKRIPGLQVLGGDGRVQALTRTVTHEEKLTIGGMNITCLSTPCHTSGHICYKVTGTGGDSEPMVFTGDTLFLGGCGRFFEGTAEQMHHALVKVLGALSDHTLVYCGHEYALQNLRFGSVVEPGNSRLQEKIKWAKGQREQTLPTVPSTIGEEKSYNPFMRVGEPTVQAHASETEEIATMAAIRKEKDNFKG